jgi:cytochrome c-type biogenesis protein CcmH/NrfF
LNKRSSSIIRKFVIVAFLAAASGAQASADRAETLGNGLICMCGCHQPLAGCQMINCPTATPMRRELKQHIDSGEDDKTILAAFSSKYGPKVLSSPPTDDWFNLSAWIMPFAVLAAGGVAVIVILKRVKTAAPVEGPAQTDASTYEKEIEEELRKLTPED